jgi:hypothetical protein
MEYRIEERETVNGRRYVVQRHSRDGLCDLRECDSMGRSCTAAYRTRAEAEIRILPEQLRV